MFLLVPNVLFHCLQCGCADRKCAVPRLPGKIVSNCGLTFQPLACFDFAFLHDLHVDGDDLLVWSTYLGLVDLLGRPMKEIGDADEDSDIDGNDFLIWQTQFTGGLASSASSANVPEPSSIILLLAAIVCGPPRRRPVV